MSASRDSRRMSVTREVHRRLSGITKDGPKDLDRQCEFALKHGTRHQQSTHKPSAVKRYFSSVPDANRRYMPVPKPLRKANRRTERKSKCATFCQALRDRLPIIDFLKSYNIKENLVADLMSGFAVTGMHFPQGLAYGILAGLTPAIGMISTVFPVLVYIFFGSSAHTSIGTNAIVSIMIGDLLIESNIQENIQQIISSNAVQPNSSLSLNATTDPTAIMSNDLVDAAVLKYKVSLVAGVTFFTGLLFLLMAAFRMGFLVTYLSQSFMSGFTTGVAVHIFSSQIKTALGVKIPAIEGVGKLVKLYYNVCANIETVNVGDFIVTIICVVILLIVKIGVNERMKLKIPIPVDFLLLVTATIISHFARLPETFNIKSLGKVELGIPMPQLPAFEPTGTLILYAIEIALVTFFLNISVIKIIARRNGYEIDENVETNAYGMCNIVAAFFSNIPASIAPPRSTLLSSMGSKTTLNASSTVVIMLILIFYCGQFFESCPQAVLASMIMVAMKDLLKQVNVLPKLWKLNKNDFTTFVIAALVCIFTDIAYGLVFGVLISLLSVINQSQRGWISVIGKSDLEDLYLDKDDYAAIHEIPNIKIVRMESSLYFATAEKFRRSIYEIIEREEEPTRPPDYDMDAMSMNDGTKSILSDTDNIHPAHHKEFLKETIIEEEDENENSKQNGNGDKDDKEDKVDKEVKDESKQPKCLIIDCIPINFIDGTGLDMLKLVIFELSCIDITVYLARCSRYMLHLLDKSDIYEYFPKENVFVDLPDAVYFALTAKKIKVVENDHTVDELDYPLPKRSRSRIMSFTSINSGAEVPYDHFLNRHGSIYQL